MPFRDALDSEITPLMREFALWWCGPEVDYGDGQELTGWMGIPIKWMFSDNGMGGHAYPESTHAQCAWEAYRHASLTPHDESCSQCGHQAHEPGCRTILKVSEYREGGPAPEVERCGCAAAAVRIVLNEYQRRNLLWLLNACGYPYGNKFSRAEFQYVNTGDWLGEVAIALAREGEQMVGPGPSDGCHPYFPEKRWPHIAFGMTMPPHEWKSDIGAHTCFYCSRTADDQIHVATGSK